LHCSLSLASSILPIPATGGGRIPSPLETFGRYLFEFLYNLQKRAIALYVGFVLAGGIACGYLYDLVFYDFQMVQ
jgi:hypothetical protein